MGYEKNKEIERMSALLEQEAPTPTPIPKQRKKRCKHSWEPEGVGLNETHLKCSKCGEKGLIVHRRE